MMLLLLMLQAADDATDAPAAVATHSDAAAAAAVGAAVADATDGWLAAGCWLLVLEHPRRIQLTPTSGMTQRK